MAALVIWMMSLTISTCITILSAAAQRPEIHMMVTAVVTLTMAVVAVQAYRQLLSQNASRSALAASTSRYVGLVWIWAATAMLFTYEFILSWREAWTFVVGLLLVGGLCVAVAWMFDRDDVAGKDDETMISIARKLNLAQIVGMLAVVAGLVADGKFVPMAHKTLRDDWAANNIFFFGALAIALIGAYALINDQKREQAHS
jgi:hypothetical protein